MNRWLAHRRGCARRRRTRSRRWQLLALAVPVALALAAFAASTVLARGSSEHGEGTRAEQKVQEREERVAAYRAERDEWRREMHEARQRRESERASRREGSKERVNFSDGVNVSLRSTCTQLTVQFSGFAPDANNVVDYQITVDQTTPAKHALTMAKAEFSFTGSSATQQIPVIGFPGHGHIDDRAHWNTNGHRGGFDISEKVECPPTPAFTVEKRQRIGGGSYTQGELVGEVGQTVEYEIIVKNTGNVPLTITPSNVIDPHCDAGTITGGPASGLLEVAASATYTCTHLLNAADHEAHSYTNTASVTAQPPDGDGDPIEHATNTVVVTVNETKKPENGSSGGNNGNNGSTTSFTPAGSGGKTPLQFQVLAFQQTTPPSLLGPQGCVRSKFRASLRSKGVAIVAFYLDGHLLRKVTARVARRGVISITINISKLRVGAHKLVAKIVMARAASSSKPVHASRSLTFVRCASAAVRPKFTG